MRRFLVDVLGLTTQAEEARLRALAQYDVLDSAFERSYQDITELAAFLCGTSVSLISFVDRERQWFKARVGLDVAETPRSLSFCAHTIPTGKTLIVPDAAADGRFASNPLVTGDPNIRFYAGAPIVESGGHVLGTVCVIDAQPRTMTEQQTRALEALARQVMVLLEQRKAIELLNKAAAEARAADKMIQESEQRLRIFVESLPVLAWIANADGYITWYNRRWYAYTGTSPEQMEGWGWQSVHDPTVLPDVMNRWTFSIQTGKPFEMVFPLRGADGVFRPFLTRVEPLLDDDGTVTQWYGTNVEVDAMQKVQEALARSEAVLKQVLTVTTDAVVDVDREWQVRYFNPKAEELYGLERSSLGKNVWQAMPALIYEGSPFVSCFAAAMDGREPSKFEASFESPVKFIVGAEVYASGDGIVMFSRDITKLKNAAAAVLQNEKLAAVGRLASSIAHEINNPLEAVMNLLYLARIEDDVEASRSYLGSADMELRRIAAIANQTLRFHRQTTKPKQMTYATLRDGLFLGFHSRMRNAQVVLEERDRSRKPVLCLEGEIRQVLVNLIGNSIDAMHGRGGRLFVRSRDGHDWRTGEAGMILTVADTGEGMSATVQEKIFEAFYTTKGIGGTGLGMWVSMEIVNRHRGRLTFRTSQREGASGTVFRLFLPHGA